jgi:S-adenosylmethionine uptake transporter
MSRVAQRPLLAFAVALGAVGALSIMDAVMKHLVLAIGVIAVSVWRSLLNLAFAGALYLPRRKAWPDRPTIRLHVARALLMTVMAVMFFWGIGRVPLAQAIALTFIAPLIALLLAALTLDERIGPKSILGSALAFLGVLTIFFGQARADLGAEALWGSAAILGSAICYAVNIVMMRRQAMAAGPLEINFFQNLVVALVWVGSIPLLGSPAWPEGQVGWLIVAASLSTTGALLFAFAYARAEASYLAVTEYSAFLWAAALGWLVFREPVSGYTLSGAVLIVGGCLMAARAKARIPGEVEVAT